MKLKLSWVESTVTYICWKWPTAKGSRLKIIVLHLFGLMRIRVAGWLLDSTAIENWLSLICFFFISNFNSNFISSPFLLSSVSSRSHRYAYNYYETGRSMFDKIRCRLGSNRIFTSDHLSSSSHEIGLTSWPSAFPIG